MGARVAPAIKQVAALAAVPPGMAGGLLLARAVVDDPNLAEMADGDHNLIQFRVVVQRVGVRPRVPLGRPPKRRFFGQREVDVHEFGMVGHDAVVRLGRVEILNDVVEYRPPPNDFAFRRAGWPDLQNLVAAQSVLADEFGIRARGDGLLFRQRLPGEQQEVAVRHSQQVVMLPPARVVPDGASVRGDDARASAPREQVAALQQQRRLQPLAQRPFANEAPLMIDQVSVGAARGVLFGEERVALERPGLVEHQPHCPLDGRWRGGRRGSGRGRLNRRVRRRLNRRGRGRRRRIGGRLRGWRAVAGARGQQREHGREGRGGPGV